MKLRKTKDGAVVAMSGSGRQKKVLATISVEELPTGRIRLGALVPGETRPRQYVECDPGEEKDMAQVLIDKLPREANLVPQQRDAAEVLL